jgi:hypothetical protein
LLVFYVFIYLSFYLFRLLNGKSVNIIDPFKKAFPDYFKIPVEQKDEFYDILSGYYEGEGN